MNACGSMSCCRNAVVTNPDPPNRNKSTLLFNGTAPGTTRTYFRASQSCEKLVVWFVVVVVVLVLK